jgi:hypothetical protein
MMNLDAICPQTFDRHHRLLTEAERRRLIWSSSHGPATHAPARPVRVALASWLRRTADRLEPIDGNGRRSAIV